MNTISILEFLELKNLWIILLLVPLLVLANIFYKARYKIREKLSFSFFIDLPLLFIIPSLVILTLAIAASRPSAGRTIYQVPVESPALFILFDVSDSMLAKDIPPNRLVFAKRALLDLVSELSRKQDRVRISIIAFAGISAVFCPLTSDYEVLKLYINSLDPQLISSSGSNLFDALNTATKTITEIGLSQPRILLVSDGEVPETDKSIPIPQYPVDIFAIGTASGAPIELPNGELLKDSSGEIVISVRHDDILKSIATQSGGTFYDANFGSDFVKRFANDLIKKSEKIKEEYQASITRYNDIGYYFIWALLTLLLIVYLIPLRAGLLCFSLLLILPKEAIADNIKGFKHLESGEYESAINQFSNIITNPNSDNKSRYKALDGRGAAYFRQNKFDQALNDYLQIAENAKQGKTAFRGYYNAANAALSNGDPAKAIELYDLALTIKPADEKTEYNKKIAEMILNQEEEEKNEESDKENEENPQDEEEESDNNEGENQNQDKQKEQSDQSDENSPDENQENQQEVDKDTKEEAIDNAKRQEQSEEFLDKKAAEKWLDSLTDAPLLIPRFGDQNEPPLGGQRW